MGPTGRNIYTQKLMKSTLSFPSRLAFGVVLGVVAAGALPQLQADTLVVADANSAVIRRYDATTGAYLGVFASGGGLTAPAGLVFGRDGNLYVGDRAGTIFKIGRDRQIYVFATIEPSIAAYHLTFGPDGHLYVTGPTTSSFDSVHRISPAGVAEVFYRGLGRPQGMASCSASRWPFSPAGGLLCSWMGRSPARATANSG